jgi:pre-mRNA-splicing factor SYF1
VTLLAYANVRACYRNFEASRSLYEQIIELRIATPQLILNYAKFLEEHRYYEDSFKAYEKGVQIFNFPYVYDIWILYLTKFVERYGGTLFLL